MIFRQLNMKEFWIVSACLLLNIINGVPSAFAASCQSNVAMGNWHDPASWINCGGVTPGESPGDLVYVLDGHSITLDVEPSNAIASMTIASAGSLVMDTKLTIGGDVQLDGRLTLPANGELFVGGDWSNNGTFLHNDGTVVFSGGDTKITGDTHFCDLILSLDTNQTFAVASGTTMTVAGNFGRTSTGDMLANVGSRVVMSGECKGGGTKSIGGEGAKNFYDFEIATGAVVDHAGTGNLNIDNHFINGGVITLSDDLKIAGDFTNNGTLISTDDVNFSHASVMSGNGSTRFHDMTVQGSDSLDANSHDFVVTGAFSVSGGGLFSGNANTVTFSGSSAQQIRGAGTKNFNHVTVDNAQGVTLSSTSAAIAATIEGTLTLTNGQLDVNGEVLRFGLNGKTANVTTTTYLVAACPGRVDKLVDDSNTAFFFPIGDDDRDYSPIHVSFSSGTFLSGAFATACVTGAKHPNNLAASDYVSRYWDVDASGVTSFNADLTATYLDDDVNGDETSYVGGRYRDTVWHIDTDAVAADTNTIAFDALDQFGAVTAGDSTLPVTLTYFQSRKNAQSLLVEWETATEINTIGFNLYGSRAGSRILLNEEMIAASGFSSLTPQIYQFEAANFAESDLYLEEINLYGKQIFGPFAIGEVIGQEDDLDLIDWQTVSAEHAALSAERARQAAPAIQQRMTQLRQGHRTRTRLARIGVTDDGIYRITHADLLAIGIDLSGLRSADLALINQDRPIPIAIVGDETWAGTSAIEFVGIGLNTLYTKENVYWLYNDSGRAARINVDYRGPTEPVTTHAMALVARADNRRYDTTNWGDDPWYMTRLATATEAVSAPYEIELDHVAPVAEPSFITLELFADSSFDAAPDHHVLLNSAENVLIDTTFDGLSTHIVTATLPSVQNGINTFTVTLPHDLGLPYDVIGVEGLYLRYPRSLVAVDDQLDFVSDAGALAVAGFSDASIRAYRIGETTITQLQTVETVADDGQYRVTFGGSSAAERYIVATLDAIKRPSVAPAEEMVDITTFDSADYLMITHANLADALAPLVAQREADGLTVRVVDVADVFDQFSTGIFDPQALKKYIAHAVNTFGTRYVLLVGNDTYDYHNYTGVGSISLIPSFYLPNGGVVRWGPADPYYADIDDDGATDVALGRFPARTPAELTTMISKTLRYSAPNAFAKRAVFASDTGFRVSNAQMGARLPADWRLTALDLDVMSVDDSRDALFGALNQGVALASFFGHSGPTMWTSQGLFSSADAARLTNGHRPTLFLQFGCWNSYYVQPDYNSLAQQLMGGGAHGAAAVLGGTTLTNPLSDQLLGDALTTSLMEGRLTIGDALQQAKATVALSHPGLVDAQIGYTILGDPALRLPDYALTSAVAFQQITADSADRSSVAILSSAALLLLSSCVLIDQDRYKR